MNEKVYSLEVYITAIIVTLAVVTYKNGKHNSDFSNNILVITGLSLLIICIYYDTNTYICLLSGIPLGIVVYNMYQRQKSAELEDEFIHTSLKNDILPIIAIGGHF